MAGDFDLNLDFNKIAKVQSFISLMFQYGLISTINKPTRLTRNTAKAMDNFFTNSILNNKVKTGIVKTDVLDYFPIRNLTPKRITSSDETFFPKIQI